MSFKCHPFLFSRQVLNDIFGNFSSGVLKHPSTRSYNNDRRYETAIQLFSPVNLGVPSQRIRKYTAFHLYPFVVPKYHLKFDELFFRTLEAGPAVYLDHVHDEARLAELAASVARRRGQGVIAVSVPLDDAVQEDIMSGGAFDRLDGFRCLAQKRGLCNDNFSDWNVPAALANITQRSEFSRQVNVLSAPALLRQTFLYDLVQDKAVSCMAHWLIQGFPHPLVEDLPGDLEKDFPANADLVTPGTALCLTDSAQKELTGNAMHWAAIGTWLLYNLACTARPLSEEEW